MCIFVSAIKRNKKTNIMETFYILNTKTDANFDTNENKFYPSSWEPVLDEKEYLETLISNDKEKFENCVIVDISI